MISKTTLAAMPLALMLAAGAARSQPEQSTPPAPAPAPADNAAPASPPPATEAQAPAKPAQVVYLATTQRPGFAMLSPGNAVFGAIGGVAAAMSSKKLAEENDFTDPANDMRVDVARAFAASKGLTVADAPIMLQPGDAKASFAAAMQTAKSQGAQYVVDLGTAAWLVVYFPLDWTHYGTNYGAAIRILDAQTGAVVTKGRCTVKPEHTPDSPDKDQLLADKAARLKSMAAQAAAKCGEILKTEVLKLPATSAASSD